MTEKNCQGEPGDEWILYPLSGPTRDAGEPSRLDGSPPALDPAWKWTTYNHGVYQCEVWVVRETSGEYSAFAAHLPGLSAQGADPDDAIAEFRGASAATIRSYLEHGRGIPWTSEPIDLEDSVPQAKRWILIQA